jgi:hypothetical protein
MPFGCSTDLAKAKLPNKGLQFIDPFLDRFADRCMIKTERVALLDRSLTNFIIFEFVFPQRDS